MYDTRKGSVDLFLLSNSIVAGTSGIRLIADLKNASAVKGKK